MRLKMTVMAEYATCVRLVQEYIAVFPAWMLDACARLVLWTEHACSPLHRIESKLHFVNMNLIQQYLDRSGERHFAAK